MARTTKVSILVALPPLVIAIVALGRTMPECLAQTGLFVLALLLVGAFFAVAFWPSDTAILDRLIQDGRATRTKIVHDELDEVAALRLFEAWYERAHEKITERFPAHLDDLIVREEPQPDLYSGQAAVIRLLVAKLTVLTEARKLT